ncbi:aminodeoxychorismate synthase component I [Alkalimonas amylolytica]|uniref:aminodeoxychorismate synthase n=1 Tax=Alkalimonas amylolytica TaxID=152573 RepID=A0A1H4AWE0_ALKAM|nr:aminodeoxychorismate synthase component I [Alkalimonas amylolytica]SEA40201.1 para-aminobenzoate synthetase [Alkalimonas amylolytica]
MKILIVDNYDSFTFNLYQYVSEVFAVLPVVVKNNDVTVDYEQYDAIIISPGPGTPNKKDDIGICETIIKETTKPLLGICLGHQSIVAAMGGEVEISGAPYHGRTSKVLHGGSGVFDQLPNPLEVVRYHSLIAYQPLPKTLIATAFTEDGLIMGVEHRHRPMWGVQFHPESVSTDCGRQIIENFKTLVERHKAGSMKTTLRTNRAPAHISRPVVVEKTLWRCQFKALDMQLAPAMVFDKLFSQAQYSFWLDTSSAANAEGRFSFMGDASGPASYWFCYDVKAKTVSIDAQGKRTKRCVDYQRFVANALHATIEGTEELPFDFCGGLVGFQGYELKSETEPVSNKHLSAQPDAAGLFVDRFIAFDHKTGLVYLVALDKASADDSAVDASALWLETMSHDLAAMVQQNIASTVDDIAVRQASHDPSQPVQFMLEDDYQAYIDKISCCKDYIKRGESYEICLTNRIRATLGVEPWPLYCVLRQVNPAPRSVYLHCPDFSVLSSSPEKFFSVGRNAVVEAKPIKGTRKRGVTLQEDAALIADLANSEKDQAENLMIVDLLRNDLNRVCEAGSVWVPKLMQVETYASVHQLVSTVRGRLNGDESLASLFAATFPPGSMTGAPKTRTLEILDELESSARGIYSGAIGYMSLNGAAELNVAIRSLVVRDDQLEIGVGGAITWLSDAEEEFEEILIKARALMRAIAKYATGDESHYAVQGAEPQPSLVIDPYEEVFSDPSYLNEQNYKLKEGLEAC